jgi:carotenoid 1,2-hydratase
VKPGGYAWWYVDALSDDGQFGLSIIAFIGSVFSPYYYWAGRRDPTNHCAINVGLYAPGRKRWTMTERGRDALHVAERSITVGPSGMEWTSDCLTVKLDEKIFPTRAPIRGTIRLFPKTLFNTAYPLDTAGRHRWEPIAPIGRVEVALEAPAMRWSGHGYFDSNFGDEPLEAAFSTWDWSRADLKDAATVLYDVRDRAGGERRLSLRFNADGSVAPFEAASRAQFSKTLWGIERGSRTDDPATAAVVQTLEDTPFYARSVLRSRICGEMATSIHESLSLKRFDTARVKLMLPFRMPRVWW